jgi:hypothetical protein
MATAHRTKTMIALRARKGSYRIASDVLHPHLEIPAPKAAVAERIAFQDEPYIEPPDGLCPACRAEWDRQCDRGEFGIVFCANCGKTTDFREWG